MKKNPSNAVADLFVYANGGHTYRKYKEVKGIKYLRCTQFRCGQARAKICFNPNIFSIIKERKIMIHQNHKSQ